MIKTFFLMGPSDIPEQNPITSEAAGPGLQRREVDLSGVLPILPFVMGDEDTSAASEAVLLGVQQIRVARNAEVNIFNIVGDPDSSASMLHTIQNIEETLKPRRCFNPPEKVFRTSREQLPKTLADIPGCRIPRVESADPKNFEELVACCTTFEQWPMIVRARGYHGGKHMVLVRQPADLETLRASQWAYGGIHLLEFIDYADEHGLYQKNRVVVIDGVPHPRHSIYSRNWAIHSGTRSDLMAADLTLCHREERFLRDFTATGLVEYADVFSEIHNRIGLDFFGIDFAIVDGQILVFEANACMNVLQQDYGKDDRYRYLETRVNTLKSALKKMLLEA